MQELDKAVKVTFALCYACRVLKHIQFYKYSGILRVNNYNIVLAKQLILEDKIEAKHYALII